MIPLPARPKMANGAPILLAPLAVGALPAAQLAPSMILPLVLPKDANGVPALMAAAGVPLLPRKPAQPLPLKHCQRQCSTGPILKLNVKNILANGAQALAVTAIVRAHAIWLI